MRLSLTDIMQASKLTHLTGEALIRFYKLRIIPERQVPTKQQLPHLLGEVS